MTHEPRSAASLFTQVDISAAASTAEASSGDENARVLRQILAALDRQNELLEEMSQQFSASQRQRSADLRQWKQLNPQLARGCRQASETLSRVQTEFLQKLTDEVNHDPDALLDGEFVLNEFVDRFGPRLAHLNGVLQVLAQLGSANSPAAPPSAT
ncbi:MAG: hypothetical protein JNG90_10625 [Planctomycetaceae bacterium]|nr:hypothetical protein [Planctomycetaceae bacterium]